MKAPLPPPTRPTLIGLFGIENWVLSVLQFVCNRCLRCREPFEGTASEAVRFAQSLGKLKGRSRNFCSLLKGGVQFSKLSRQGRREKGRTPFGGLGSFLRPGGKGLVVSRSEALVVAGD